MSIENVFAQLEIERGETLSVNGPIVTSSSGREYYVKLGSSSLIEQYEGEAACLEAMHAAAPGLAPKLIASGSNKDGRPYMISEYKHLSRLDADATRKLARRLAQELHSSTSSEGFGFHVPTFCGPTRLANGWYPTWEECYSAMIGDLLTKLAKEPLNAELCRRGEQVRTKYPFYVPSLWSCADIDGCRVIPVLLRPLNVQPVLLHGDLWVRKLVPIWVHCTSKR